MLLKRLTTSIPPVLHPLISELEIAGIKTTENLLFTPLATVLSLLDDPEAQYEVEQLIERCLRLTAPVSRSGVGELKEEEKVGGGVRWTGFGAAGLDELVGDWEGRGVVEICGPQRVGKSVGLRYAGRIFSSDREKEADMQVYMARHGWVILFSSGSGGSRGHRLSGEVLARLNVSPCYNLDPDLWAALEAIKAEESKEAQVARTTILVVDSVTPLLKDHLMGSGSQGHAAMITMMEEISELAHSKGLTAIVTNATASARPSNPASTFTATDIKPALGVGFSYFGDITLLLQSTGKLFGEMDEGERDRAYNKPGLRGVVEVMKSRISVSWSLLLPFISEYNQLTSQRTGAWAVFETDGKTLLDVIPAPLEDERTMMMSAGQQVGVARPAYGNLRDTLAA